jgi:hypothetical protein
MIASTSRLRAALLLQPHRHARRGAGNFTVYSPDETGSSLTLTVTNLYDVGANTIIYSETADAPSAPEPSTALMAMAAMAGGMFLFPASRRRRKLPITPDTTA